MLDKNIIRLFWGIYKIFRKLHKIIFGLFFLLAEIEYLNIQGDGDSVGIVKTCKPTGGSTQHLRDTLAC
jgi:hypothetical protein